MRRLVLSLSLTNSANTAIGTPLLTNARVLARVEEHAKTEKVSPQRVVIGFHAPGHCPEEAPQSAIESKTVWSS